MSFAPVSSRALLLALLTGMALPAAAQRAPAPRFQAAVRQAAPAASLMPDSGVGAARVTAGALLGGAAGVAAGAFVGAGLMCSTQSNPDDYDSLCKPILGTLGGLLGEVLALPIGVSIASHGRAHFGRDLLVSAGVAGAGVALVYALPSRGTGFGVLIGVPLAQTALITALERERP